MGEALDVGAVLHAGEELAGDLGFLVVRHLHARGRAERGSAPPVGDAAAFRDVVVHEVHRAGIHQPPHAVAGDLALARGDRDAGRLPHGRHHGGVVVPVARFLEPANVERLDQVREADGVVHVPAAVRVHHQHEVLPGRLARNFHALEVLFRGQAADLELAARHAGGAVLLHFLPVVGERLAFHVVAADRDDGQTLAVAAEEAPHAFPFRLADEVPHRAVHAGNRLEQRLAVAVGVREPEHRLPGALDLEDVHAFHARRELFVDQADDLAPVLAVVAVVDLAREPFVRAHARDHRRALENGIRAAAEVLLQRNIDRDRLNALNLHLLSGSQLVSPGSTRERDK